MKAVILKDYHENEKKCSILPLKGKPEFEFVDFKDFDSHDFSGLTMLHPEGEIVEKLNAGEKLLIVDSNWTKARRKYTRLEKFKLKKIRIDGFQTAYPWKKNAPQNTLCSIEALFVARLLAGIYDASIMDNYYYKDKFLELNKGAIARFKHKLSFPLRKDTC